MGRSSDDRDLNDAIGPIAATYASLAVCCVWNLPISLTILLIADRDNKTVCVRCGRRAGVLCSLYNAPSYAVRDVVYGRCGAVYIPPPNRTKVKQVCIE